MQTFVKRKAGQGMTEYIIIIAIVAVAALAITMMFGEQIRMTFARLTDRIGGEETEGITPITVSTDDLGEIGMGDF